MLDSGNGGVSVVDERTGDLTTVARLPGFTRGLDFWDRCAFVGLSQVRETAVFSGIAIALRPESITASSYFPRRVKAPPDYFHERYQVSGAGNVEVIAGPRLHEPGAQPPRILQRRFS